MKTARFTNVVERAGDPEPHLVLTKPEDDAELRRAIKGHRVMTVFQETVGHHADRGTVGFEPGPNRQFLIFRKSLLSFEGKEIVGIKYDLLKVKEVPKSQRAATPKPPRPRKHMPQRQEARIESAEEKQPPDSREHGTIAVIKQKVRRAMKALEEGKAVAAFNLLKQIVERE